MKMEDLGEPHTTEEEILIATYHALVEYGYAGLTIEKIGEHFEKSPSLIYHHFENKDQVVLACLEFMLDRYKERIPQADLSDSPDHLCEFLDHVFRSMHSTEDAAFLALLVDLRSQAVHNEAYREHFSRSDRIFRDHFAAVIERAQEEGSITVDDETAAADLVLTVLIGSLVRGTTAEDTDWTDRVSDAIFAYLNDRNDRGE